MKMIPMNNPFNMIAVKIKDNIEYARNIFIAICRIISYSFSILMIVIRLLYQC